MSEGQMPDPIPFEKLIEPDPWNLALVGPITTDGLQELFREWQLRKEVPEDIRKQFEVAKKLFVYGYFVHEFYTLASFVSILAVESALIHRFSDHYNREFDLTKKDKGTTARSYEGVRTLLLKGWRLRDDSDFKDGFKSLILWAGRKKLIEDAERYADSLPRIRASHAHPLFQAVLPIGMAHTTMAKAIELINELFGGKQSASPR